MANVIVLFEVTIKEDKMGEYLKQVTSLKEALANADGFISAIGFTQKLFRCILFLKKVYE